MTAIIKTLRRDVDNVRVDNGAYDNLVSNEYGHLRITSNELVAIQNDIAVIKSDIALIKSNIDNMNTILNTVFNSGNSSLNVTQIP